MEEQTQATLEKKGNVGGPSDFQDRIIAALIEKMGDREGLVCPISGPTTWSVGEYTTALPALKEPSRSSVQNAPRIPLAVVMCDHCGYTFFVNLIVLGLAQEFGFEDAQR